MLNAVVDAVHHDGSVRRAVIGELSPPDTASVTLRALDRDSVGTRSLRNVPTLWPASRPVRHALLTSCRSSERKASNMSDSNPLRGVTTRRAFIRRAGVGLVAVEGLPMVLRDGIASAATGGAPAAGSLPAPLVLGSPPVGARANQRSSRAVRVSRAGGESRPPAAEAGAGGETHQTVTEGGVRLTTQQGVPVADDQNTLRVGERGPALLEDFHFREKIFHFDHERIPERVVHARGYRRARLLRDLRVARRRHPRRSVPARRASRRRRSCASRPWPATRARPIWRATCAASRSSSTPRRATGTSSATTSRCSSSRTRSSSPT